MLELIILSVLGGHIARRARSEGKSATGAVLLLVALWLVGTAAGLIAGLIVMLVTGAGLLVGYCAALLGGIAGARTAFATVGPDAAPVPPVDGPWRGTARGRRRRLLVILAVLGAALTAALILRPRPPADLAALQGEWVLERTERNGQAWAASEDPPRLTVTGNEIRRRGSEAARFRIDPETSPPRIDVAVGAFERPFWQSGIYRLEGDRWLFCLRENGGVRPERFETRPGSESVLYVYRRAEK